MGTNPHLLVVVIVLCFLHLCSSCIQRERQALLAFKSSVVDPSNRLSSWVGHSCCKWYGVECNNRTGHVVELNLSNQLHLEEDDLVASEVNPSLVELKHLEYLDISSNNFSGSEIPKFIGNFSKLRHLILANSRFAGAVPVSLGQLSKLEALDLADNSLTGEVSEIHFEKLSRLDDLDLSSNSLVFNVSFSWTPPFQLKHINLGSCLVGPKFPAWLQTQNIIREIRLDNTSISDSIPNWFSSIASNFHTVDLSDNQIHGLVPDFTRITSSSFSLFLGSNNFEGPLPPFPSNTEEIFLSDNFISGSLPQNISAMMPKLQYLLLSTNSISGSIPTSLFEISSLVNINLSNNKFSGEIPRNCWSNLKEKVIMSFSNNNLTGVIPSSNFSSVCALSSLRLRKNNFYGEIPSALRNCESLSILDIGENGFSGNISSWIGGFQALEVFSLRSNKFEGSIAPELCHANNIRILDLAENKFSGIILPCFKNFTGMKLGSKLWGYGYIQELIQEMKGRGLNYTRTLPFLVNLELSSNNLEGEIPQELTLLTGLIGLHLSNNQLTGEIPKEIGNLRLLESLDFSHNLLTGVIPQSISELNSVSYLDLSYNNLSGRIPNGNQLQTFDPSIYRGNPSLCGIQIQKLCGEEEPTPRNNVDKPVKGKDFEMVWFYVSIIIGFVVGFWGVWCVLFCKKTWRATYFRLVENIHDLVLMKVAHLCRG